MWGNVRGNKRRMMKRDNDICVREGDDLMGEGYS